MELMHAFAFTLFLGSKMLAFGAIFIERLGESNRLKAIVGAPVISHPTGDSPQATQMPKAISLRGRTQ